MKQCFAILNFFDDEVNSINKWIWTAVLFVWICFQYPEICNELNIWISRFISEHPRWRHHANGMETLFALQTLCEDVPSGFPSQNIFRVTIPFLGRIHRSPMDSLHKGQWRRALMFPLMCAWTISWGNNRDAGDLRRHRAHFDVTIITCHVHRPWDIQYLHTCVSNRICHACIYNNSAHLILALL